MYIFFSLEQGGMDYVMKLMKQLAGGWPVLDHHLPDTYEFDFIDYTHQCRENKFSITQLIDIEIIRETDESPKNYSIVSVHDIYC